ncbi:MAG: hypothetical protein HC794_04490 [Nitrospiraceae bacterium]|nr:hypothetical protein [Nitrospiraceae bacterium]
MDDKYKEPLYGDRSLASLTRRIERTMPEEEPELCVGEDAAAVAKAVERLVNSTKLLKNFRCVMFIDAVKSTNSH